MASPYVRPDTAELSALERLVGALEEQLVGWRRRSFKAEAELQDAKGRPAGFHSPELAAARERVAELEAENRVLVTRIGAAREQLEQLRTRLRFIEDQAVGDHR